MFILEVGPRKLAERQVATHGSIEVIYMEEVVGRCCGGGSLSGRPRMLAPQSTTSVVY